MIDKPISNRAFSLWSLITAFEGIVAVYFLTEEPSEPGSVFAFGLSSQRLFIATSIFFVAIFFLIVAIVHYFRFASWNESLNTGPKTIRYLLTFAFLFEIVIVNILFLLPDYYFPTFSGYLLRLIPVLIWLALFFAQTFIFLAYYHGLSLDGLKDWRGNISIIIILIAMIIVWVVIAATKIGIIPDDYYWNMSGVPILAGQIWMAVGVTIISWLLLSQFVLQRKKDTFIFSLLIFIGIWIVAAIIWVKTPLAPTFNAPGPYLPSKGFYPFVDAALYDLGAQSAIYGKGINFGSFIDRGLLMGFLAVLHMFFGQNYLVIVGVQSAAFAVFPALLYLLGEKLHSKAAGLMVAMLAIFKVSNAIDGGKWLSTSHPKLTLTEFPTGIVLVLFSLYLVFWLKENKTKAYCLASVGASTGIGIMLRQNVFFMVPVVLALGAVTVWKLHWQLALRDILLFVAAFFITISPWMWRNQRIAGEPFFFLSHFNRVIEERYEPQSNFNQIKIVSHLPSRALKNSAIVSRAEKTDIFDQYQFIPKHFAHNIISSVLILPPSPVLDDLRHVVDNYPYWNRMDTPWLGQISVAQGIFLATNLIILSIGFGVTWKRVRFVSLVPLAVFLFYNLANAFARTSGGRYLVPADWVVYFYYAIGLVEIVRFCISRLGYQTDDFYWNLPDQKQNIVNRKMNWGKAGLAVLPFFLAVTVLPVIELTSPGDKPPETKAALMQQLDKTSFFDRSGLSRSAVNEFLNNPDSILITGRGLYPRYYSHEQGEPILPGQMTAYTARDYPRLVFTLLLPNTDKPVVFPIDEPRLHFPDAVEVIVGGCQVGQSAVLTSYLNYIDAAFIVILDDSEVIYTRVPEAPLSCPLREPVCDNNHNCN